MRESRPKACAQAGRAAQPPSHSFNGSNGFCKRPIDRAMQAAGLPGLGWACHPAPTTSCFHQGYDHSRWRVRWGTTAANPAAAWRAWEPGGKASYAWLAARAQPTPGKPVGHEHESHRPGIGHQGHLGGIALAQRQKIKVERAGDPANAHQPEFSASHWRRALAWFTPALKTFVAVVDKGGFTLAAGQRRGVVKATVLEDYPAS